jgi:hypothetical protein
MLNIKNCNPGTQAFTSCSNLASITFVDLNISATRDLRFFGCALTHSGLVKLFASLPQVTSGSLNLQYNPGLSELTDSEKAIATGKGWTLTL